VSDFELVVRVEAKFYWRETAESVQEEMRRQQQNLRLESLVRQLQPEVKQMVLDNIEVARAAAARS
jgi:hypothetical protein